MPNIAKSRKKLLGRIYPNKSNLLSLPNVTFTSVFFLL